MEGEKNFGTILQQQAFCLFCVCVFEPAFLVNAGGIPNSLLLGLSSTKAEAKHLTYPNTESMSLQVSWLRHLYPIPQLLALNNLTNSPDPRVTAFHTPGSEKYVLRIQHARLNDSGPYECQVAGNGRISIFKLIYLDVVGKYRCMFSSLFVKHIPRSKRSLKIVNF